MMKLLIGYDGSECAGGIFDDLPYAGLPAEVEAIVIAVEEEWMPLSSSFGMAERILPSDSKAALEKEALADEGAGRLRGLFKGWSVTAEAMAGSPASALISRADTWQPDLVVVGSHGRSALGRLILGSVSQRVVTEAHSSVRISRTRTGESGSPPRIIIGADGSPGSDAAVNEVARRNWPRGTEVRIVSAFRLLMPAAFGYAIPQVMHAVDESNERYEAELRKAVDAAADRLTAAGLLASGVVQNGDPKSVLVEAAREWNADSIFVGAKGMSKLERLLLGSVSTGVAARADCSVEVIRPR
jgi:nucleotide-binding universal stress UspA family protein